MVTTSIRVAEMIKYASNAWHALKVCFGNEIGNFCKRLGVDSHEVMEIFCQDDKLNLSPYYLKPGFAFGGSCLPKDVRALEYRAQGARPRAAGAPFGAAQQQLQIQHAIDQVVETGKKRIGLLGFSFKAGTDDLRESPMVILAETLLGKGYDLRIYDQNVLLARLTGANKEYIEQQIPHLSRSCLRLEHRRRHERVGRHRHRQQRARNSPKPWRGAAPIRSSSIWCACRSITRRSRPAIRASAGRRRAQRRYRAVIRNAVWGERSRQRRWQAS